MVLPSMRLDGMVAIVKGAGSGIGKAVAVAVAEAGADCVPTEVPEKMGDLEPVCADPRKPGGLWVAGSRKTAHDLNRYARLRGRSSQIWLCIIDRLLWQHPRSRRTKTDGVYLLEPIV